VTADERGCIDLKYGQIRLKVEILLHDYFYDMFEKDSTYGERADSCTCRVMELFEEATKDAEDDVWTVIENRRYDGEGLA